MKFLLFGAFVLLGVPAFAYLGYTSLRARKLLLGAIVFFTSVADNLNINFVSMPEYRGIDRGFEVHIVDVFTAALALALLMRSPGKLKFFPFNFLPMLVFFLFAIWTTMEAQVPLYAWFSVWKLARLYLVYWTVYNALRAGVPVVVVWKAFATIAIVMAYLAAKQHWIDHIPQVTCWFAHQNAIPSYLLLFMAPMLIYALTDRTLDRRTALIFILAVLSCVFVILATLSRGGMALMPVSLLGGLAISNVRVQSVRGITTTFVILFFMLAGGIAAADSVIRRFESAPEASGLGRKEFNMAARGMIRDFPSHGVGLNNYPHALIYPRYQKGLHYQKGEQGVNSAHHIYLLTAAEVGWPGVILFCFIMFRFSLPAAWQGLRGRSVHASMLLGFVLGMACVQLIGMLEFVIRVMPVAAMYMIVCAVTTFLAENVRAERKARALMRSQARAAPQPAVARRAVR